MELSIICIKNVFKAFGQTKVLEDSSYIFEQDKSYAITGKSGSGKSTLLHMLCGLEEYDKGEIYFNNSDINSLSQAEKDKMLFKDIGIVFQEPFLINELSVVENVMLKCLINNEDYISSKDKAMYYLKKIGLEDKHNQSPAVLSGGQKQRIAILRALFNNPKFLLADEPTGNLDENSAKEIMDFLVYCKDFFNMGLIVSTHDLELADSMNVLLELKSSKLLEKNNQIFLEKNCERDRIYNRFNI